MKYHRWPLITGVLVLLVIVGAVYTLPAMFSVYMCNNGLIEEVKAPDGQHKAVIFQRDCGATTGFSTQVSILDADDGLPDEGGNIFVADTDHGRAPHGRGGGPDVRVEWISPDKLILRHHPLARVFSAQSKVGDIQIQYMAFADSTE